MSSVDIIVPCYRYAHYLRECVNSVLSQSIRQVRILIINDASPDHTAEVAAELLRDSRVSYIEHATNKGHIYSYNEGIEWASADYLLLLSADDYLLPGALQRAVELMEKHPQVGLVFGTAIEMDEQGRQRITNTLVSENEERVLAGSEFILLSGPRNIVPTPTAVVRTAVQKRAGGYRKELPHAGDMELWLRLAAYGEIGFIKSPQAVYRRHARNMSLSYTGQSCLRDIEQRKAALDCFFETCSQLLSNPNRLRRRLSYLLGIDALHLASAVFNHGEVELANELYAFAIQTSPSVTKSRIWAKFLCKRAIGLRLWQALHPTAKQARRLVYESRAS